MMTDSDDPHAILASTREKLVGALRKLKEAQQKLKKDKVDNSDGRKASTPTGHLNRHMILIL